MCGIAVRNRKRTEAYDDEMKHRGILTYKDEYGALELIHEHLPIQTFNSDHPIIYINHWTILFNGEIFDHDYKDDLEYIWSVFDSSKNIFEAVEEIKNRDGFYSFIVLDTIENKIFGFTDPLGKKQLYYSQGFGIASEIRGVLVGEESLDHPYFGTIQKFGYNIDDRTPYCEVKRLLPNKLYTFSIDLYLEAIDDNIYDFFNTTIFGSDLHDIRDILYHRIDRAVKNRLIGHKKIALLLSGGLDSSIINHHLKDSDVAKYTVSNKEDSEYALRLCPDANMISFCQTDFKKPLIAMEMPIDLGSMVPQYNLCKAVNETVILTGDGADELFGGYKRVSEYDSQLSDIFDELTYYHLIRLDRMSMAFTKELRSPFLNLDVVKFALSLNREERTHKKILRDTYREILPEYIVDRKKVALKIDKVAQTPFEYRAELIEAFYAKGLKW